MSSASTNVTRRDLVRAGAFGAVALSAASSIALADEQGTDEQNAGEQVWDETYDVVVLGTGFAGMAAAIAASDAGASVLMCEKAPEGESGGNSRVCGQIFANTNGDVDAARQYYTALAGGRDVPQDMVDVFAEGVAGIKDTLVNVYGLNSDEFMGMKGDARFDSLSPEYPEFAGADKMDPSVAHEGVADSFLFQHIQGLIQQDHTDTITIWYEFPAVELIQDADGIVTGVVVEHEGATLSVRAQRGVCVCTGGFENDEAMKQTYLDIVGIKPYGGAYNTGDGIRMCQKLGANLWHMTAYETPNMNYCYPCDEGERAIALNAGMYSSGSCMLVGTLGRRVLNEVSMLRHGHAHDGNGSWVVPRFPNSCWLVFDQAQMDDIDAGEMYDEAYRDDLMSFSSVAEAEGALGFGAGVLQKTIDNWNMFCDQGEDYQFGRDTSTMRAFEGDVVYALPLSFSIMNTQGGPEHNAHAEVIDVEGNPIPHLYAAGECGAMFPFQYQGGSNVAECLIYGAIAGANAAANA